MRKQLLATTILLSLLSTAAFAQDSGDPVFRDDGDQELSATNGFYESNDNQVLATSLIGEPVYTRGKNGEDDTEEVGTITDVLLDQSGNARAVVIGVGGFLGMGEKEVAVDFDELRWSQSMNQSGDQSDAQKAEEQAGDQDEEQASDQDQMSSPTATGGRRLTIEADKERLEEAPEFDRERVEENQQDTKMGTTDREEQKADTSSGESDAAKNSEDESSDQPTDDQAADEDTQSQDEEREGESTANTLQGAGLTADELTGMTVYGQDDEEIGSVSDALIGENDKLEAFLINVGGFLGIGEKTIAVSLENVQIREEDGERVLVTNFTEEQLEDQPAFDEEAYREGDTDLILRSE